MKENIIIHACPARMWYVNNFLVPSLQNQELENIYIVNDKYKVGNLLAFVKSLELNIDAWHLQDDVIICRDFAKRIKKLSGVCCGFSSRLFEPENYTEGKTKPAGMGFSFPCIRIPAEVAEGFYNWFYNEAQNKYLDMINSGKMDDLLFREYLIEERPEEDIINLNPSLVDHIDYLLGGSVANKAREGRIKQARATNFDDLDLVKALEGKVIKFRTEGGF